MKEIKIFNTNIITLVDDEDFEWLNQFKWRILNGPKTSYARTEEKEGKKWFTKLMHKMIMKTPNNMQTDHIDHNGLNNQKNNLRIVTRSQNRMNSLKYNNSSSKFKGVLWHKRDTIWEAYIRKDKKQIYLGRFSNEEDAAVAYNKKATELFGEYAYLNEVD